MTTALKKLKERLNFGIDLGNSNVSVAYRLVSGDTFVRSELIALDPSQLGAYKCVLPAAVFFASDERPPVVGGRAKTVSSSEGILFTNFKEELLSESDVIPRVDRNLTKSSEDALTEIFRYLLSQVVNSDDLIGKTTLGADGQRVLETDYSVTVGVPTKTSEKYRDRLTRAIIAAGWFDSMEAAQGGAPKRLQFLPEPVAVILNIGHPGNKRYLVYDHGGATLDIAEVTTHDTGIHDFSVTQKERPTLSWQGTENTNIGGTFLDRLLLGAAVADRAAVAALLPHIAEAYGLECDASPLENLIRRAEPVQGKPPIEGEEALGGGTPEIDAYRYLCADIEKVRIRFSGRTNSEILVLGEDQETDILISRLLLEKTFKPVSEAIKQYLVTSLAEGVREKGSAEEVLCLLAGGVSLTPFFLKAIEEAKYPVHRFSSEVSPFTAIATGLAQYYRGGVETIGGQGSDVTDTEYGIWIERDQKWEIIVPEKTPYNETKFPPVGKGISKRFKPYPPTDEITLRVGQCIKGQWENLGSRDVTLPSYTNAFRVYFSIDPEQGRLELRLEDSQSKRLITMNNPFFSSSQ